jgi:FSR family fosmidomycin resistance protein-like MFS transporter
VFGAREAAWPLIRDELGLTYLQIGVLLSAPNVVSSLIEPIIGVLGDVWKRRVLILGGGVVFGVTCVLVASSMSFWTLLLAFSLMYPASGAFVSLAQASLMDYEPDRHQQNMARWTFAGSVGVVAGPIALGAAVWLGLGWRGLFVVFGLLFFALVGLAARYPLGHRDPVSAPSAAHPDVGFWQGMWDALGALRRRDVLRWLILLDFSDLMLDVLLGYLALYFVDVVGGTAVQAGIAVAVWSGVGLVGDFLMIPLLERVKGLAYLRWSVLTTLVLFPAFLLLPSLIGKIVLVGLIGLANAGWYSILQGKLYSAMPGQSGAVMTVSGVFGLVGQGLPFLIGAMAQYYGLNVAMWLLLLGPVVLIIGLPRRSTGAL